MVLSLAYSLHMLATVIWIGGLMYQSLFLLPAIQRLQHPDVTRALLERLRTRFQPAAWLSLAVLIGTGLLQMAANTNYTGILGIDNDWSRAILAKHVAIGFMIGLAAYQSFILFPKLSRSLLRKSQENPASGADDSSIERRLSNLNIALSIIVLLLTAIARTS